MKVCRGIRGIAPLILNLGSRWRWELYFTFHIPVAFIWGKEPQYSSSGIRIQDRPASSPVAIVTILWLAQEGLERNWRQAILVWFWVGSISRRFWWRNWGKCEKKIIQNRRPRCRYFNPGPPEYPIDCFLPAYALMLGNLHSWGKKCKRNFCFCLRQSIYLCGKPKAMLQRLAKWGEALRNYFRCSSFWC